MDGIITLVSEYFAGPLGKVELFATISSLICVWLATKQNIWTWFFGAVGVILFGYLFFQYMLFSNAALQIFFFLPAQLIGYLAWKRQAAEVGETAIQHMSAMALVNTLLAVLVGTAVIGFLMGTYLGAAWPIADAFITCMSIAAQILMIRKFIENWGFWLTLDAAAIVVYFAQGLVVTSGLYVIFFFLAAFGGYCWWKQERLDGVPANA